MSFHDLVMAIGLFVMAGIIMKGFWAFKRVKPDDQPDGGS